MLVQYVNYGGIRGTVKPRFTVNPDLPYINLLGNDIISGLLIKIILSCYV